MVDIAIVHKATVTLRAEELAEVEGLLLIAILAHQTAEIVGVDMQCRQGGVRIGIAKMIDLPVSLGLLLHHVVPCKDFIFLMIIE